MPLTQVTNIHMTESSSNNSQKDLTAPPDGAATGASQSLSPCLVCGGQLATCRLPGLLQCGTCSFITADVKISDAELKALYGTDYFHGEEYSDYVQEETSLKMNFSKRLSTLMTHLDAPSTKTLFEIGCAYGFFLDVARGKFAHVSGIDISEDAIAHARDTLSLDAAANDVLEHEFAKKPDVICMWDVIEHLKNPDDTLAKVADVISPGGLVAITTGDIGSFNARMRGPHWRMIHPPTHLHYFSLASLERLLNEKGFDVVHVEYPGVTRTFGQIFYGVLVLRQQMHGLYDAIENLPFMDWKISLNLFDIMYVIARRRPDAASGGDVSRT